MALDIESRVENELNERSSLTLSGYIYRVKFEDFDIKREGKWEGYEVSTNI